MRGSPGPQLALPAPVLDRFADFRRSAKGPTGAGLSSVSAGGARQRRAEPASVVIGLSGARQNAAVALCEDGNLTAFCEQERATRVRRIGLTRGQVPAEALEVVLRCSASAGASTERATYATAESGIQLPEALSARVVDHHLAHAATAFYQSTFERAAVLVCDRHSTGESSVWLGDGDGLTRQEWSASAAGFARLYAEATEAFGFAPGQEHQLEALARLGDGNEADRLASTVVYRDGILSVDGDWRATLSDWLRARNPVTLGHQAVVASAVQHHLGSLLLLLAEELRSRTGASHLCLGGGLFFNTSFTTLLRQSGLFGDVSVAINPGNAGLAAGAALWTANDGRRPARPISPFLGPEFTPEEIKHTLDNCKLSYECLDEGGVVDAAVQALRRGQLVGWFQGRMEWGHRALGNRSILANPLSPYVLDNLNVFLKHRERHRTYGVSVPDDKVLDHFEGPPLSRHMEFEYRPRDPDRFRGLLPDGAGRLRGQTIPAVAEPGSSHLFRRLHEEFERVTGVPVLVNTSFNAFREPMVCSPRDAIRVFFGTGLDLLVLGRFVVRK